jgi:uncharacterized protein
MSITLDHLRQFTVARSLFPPTTLKRALHRMGFVQADPIRAPARAQDLILRHRVNNYRAGDLERHYEKLGIHEDFFINYGFVTSELQALMHPRSDSRVPAEGRLPWPPARKKRAQLLLDFIRERGVVHPREVDDHFSHGTVRNYWGGKSNATTHLLAAMHYRGLLRVVRREAGIRLYAAHEHASAPSDDAAQIARLDALMDAAVYAYAPLPARSLNFLLRRMRFAAPQWQHHLTSAVRRARQRLAQTEIEGITWYWPAQESATESAAEETVRLLAPFDPVVFDRARFELLWGWIYRFEAYTPRAKRIRGYYAMPVLWRDRVIGWGNLSLKEGSLKAEFGYVKSVPRERAFGQSLEQELERIRIFLGLSKMNPRSGNSPRPPSGARPG